MINYRMNQVSFYYVFDVFEDFCYAVRFPGWPSGPAAGLSGTTAANLHFPKNFNVSHWPPSCRQCSFSAPFPAGPKRCVFMTFATFWRFLLRRKNSRWFFFCLGLVSPLFSRESKWFFFLPFALPAPENVSPSHVISDLTFSFPACDYVSWT